MLKLNLMENHGTTISRLISRMVNIHVELYKKFIRCMVCQFFLSGEILYRRNRDTTLLQCIDATKANHLMEEMHEGLLGAHASGNL